MAGLLTLGRVLLGLCFALDGGWWLFTWDVRAAYLDQFGAPAFLIVPIAVVYVSCGVLVAGGRMVRPAVLPLLAVAGLIGLLLHTDLGPGGIGEYPLDQHPQVNSQALLAQITLVGSLMLAFGAPSLRLPIDLRAVVFGRVLLGGYFLAHALWQAHYYDVRLEHIETSGTPPGLLPIGIAIQIVSGMMLAAGRAVRLSVVLLALVTVASTIAVHGNLSPGAVFPPNVQVHQWFVNGAIVAGLAMLFALGPVATPRRPVAEAPVEPEASTGTD